jgi:hypothetical protein
VIVLRRPWRSSISSRRSAAPADVSGAILRSSRTRTSIRAQAARSRGGRPSALARTSSSKSRGRAGRGPGDPAGWRCGRERRRRTSCRRRSDRRRRRWTTMAAVNRSATPGRRPRALRSSATCAEGVPLLARQPRPGRAARGRPARSAAPIREGARVPRVLENAQGAVVQQRAPGDLASVGSAGEAARKPEALLAARRADRVRRADLVRGAALAADGAAAGNRGGDARERGALEAHRWVR